ncbi:MAG: hypothetical protein Q8N05_06275 [Bacteroidota bacterium]|nr:hypothetical protein [Bacteroidota bacterium]
MDGAYIALRGYKFQFDRTILEIFNKPTTQIEIEQLQDYSYDDYLVQVKYHNTDYTPAEQKQKIKKPLVQIIEQFLKDKSKRFILYIYLKGILPSKKSLTVSELDSILGKTTKFTVAEKTTFVKIFTLIYADDFENQYANVINKIKTNYSKTVEEAEIYYSVISSYLLEIVTNNPPSKSTLRVSSKDAIDRLISNGKKMIFKSAFVELLAKEKQIKYLNKLFFRTSINKEPNDRIFIVEINNPVENQILKELILTLKTKWSKNKTKTIPDSDRFVPYVFFKGIEENDLVRLKSDLQKDGYIIKDGYDFMNSSFSLDSIKERPTFANKLFFKFINKQTDLELLLSNQDRTCEIYQFFIGIPSPIIFSEKHIKIEIKEVIDIKNII